MNLARMTPFVAGALTLAAWIIGFAVDRSRHGLVELLHRNATRQGARPRLGESRHEHFWLQRLTAVANLFLAFAFIAIVIALAGKDYASARALLGNPLVAMLLALFVISGCIHMRIGMQVVIED